MNNDLYLKLDQYFTTGMTPFQMRNFVVKDFVTAYRQLRQVVIEMKARSDNRQGIVFEVEEIQVHLDKLAQKNPADEFEGRLDDIQRRRYEHQISQKMNLLVQMDFELATFGNTLDQLIEVLGGVDAVVEKLQSPEFHEQEEEAFWVEKIARSAYSDLINFGTISKGVVDTIALMPQNKQQLVFDRAVEEQMATVKAMGQSRDTLLVAKD